MKSIFGFLIAALLAIPPMASAAIIIDGDADAQYGSAIVTQQLGTTAQDSTLGLKGQSNGSELDAAYGFISNGVVYLVFSGNFDTGNTNGSTAVPYDKLNVFFMTGPGGQNVLSNGTYAGADSGNLNRMSGLRFDTGFAPNYWMSLLGGGIGTNPTFYVNFARLSTTNNSGAGFYLGSSNPPNYIPLTNTTQAGASVGNPLIAAFNNSNTVGVAGDPSGCQSNGAPFSPGSVRTGVELAIPVSVIGLTTGNVSICAFFVEDQYTNAYNQVLPPVSTNGCVGSFGPTTNVDFSTLPGLQYFTIAAPPCTFGLNPISANFSLSGGTGSFSIVVAGLCPWALTSNVPWVTITSPTSGSGPGTVNYSVGTNTTAGGRQGVLTLLNPPSPPLTFAINEFGPPLGSIPIDGSVETNHYGCAPLTIQLIGTGYGDSNLAAVDTANGSELDAAYGVIENGVLYIVLAGNLESNNNKLSLFFETGPGGQSTLTTNYPGVDSNGLNRMGTNGNGATNGTPGLTFDAGFAPNYWISVGCGGNPFGVYANYAQLTPGGSNGYFLGRTAASTNGTLFGGTNPSGIQATVNNTNTFGVSGDGCYDDPSTFQQGSVRTGVELGIPLTVLGNPTGAIRICAFVSDPGYVNLSNQILGPPDDGTHDGTYCPANLGESSLVNFSALPGQHYFVVGPEMRVTGITRTGNNINVSWLTEANSNLVYQLQRTSTLTPSVWANVGSSTNGTGAAITQTDTSAATNSAEFYRVKQTPTCP